LTRTVPAVESLPVVLDLDDDQARALAELGQRLASDRLWWGAPEQGESARRPTVVHCEPYGAHTWRITINDAIGVLAVRDLQINVLPKIPLEHVLWLFAASGEFPRLDPEKTSLARAEDLWELVAHWCVQSIEDVLRKDLMRDYVERREPIGVVRGRVDALETARSYYRGSLLLTCEFDEFEIDTPLNRILLAGARTVAASSLLPRSLRRQAMRVIVRMEGVGDLAQGDLRAQIDRRSGHYSRALALAKHVIRGTGRTLRTGEAESHGFLIRTPEMIEEGLRRILTSEMKDLVPVRKRGRQLQGSTMTFNPDLVFGGVAIGDVKYKVYKNEWKRNDLYQVLAFSTAYQVKRAMVAAFGEGFPAPVVSGDYQVEAFLWTTSQSPADSQEGFVQSVRTWLLHDVT
jgi:5-methylcytosine-specific restriction enzyme subunit McrC